MFGLHFAVWPHGLPHHLTLPATSLYANLDISAQRYPDKVAIVYYGASITYRELKRQVDALAGHLQHTGVKKGDRVLLDLENSPQFVIGYYAILRANAVVVPINPMNQTRELEHYVLDTEANVCLCGQEVLERVAPLIGTSNLAHLIVAAYHEYVDPGFDLPLPAEVACAARPVNVRGAIRWRDAVGAGAAPGPLQAGPEDLAVLPYSSGTTGAPKGCMHTHRSVMATCVQGIAWGLAGASSEAVTLAALPFFHVTGMQVSMNCPIYAGGTIVIMTRWDRRTAAALIARYRVTTWTNIVTMAIDLLSDPDSASFNLASLQFIGGGGAPMSEAVSDKLFKLTGQRYIEGYGLTETMAGTHINPPDKPKKHCLGIPVFDVDSRIIDLKDHRLLGVDEVGEIVIHAPQVFRGYWRQPDDTQKAFIEIDGEAFFRTGDIGRYDHEGYFFIVDRLKRMINVSGFKVWPAEVENIMYGNPAIQQICVVSCPDPRRGETVKAIVTPTADQRGKVRAEDIVAWCRDRMAAYKVPQIVEFRDELPRSPTGKVMWRALQEQEWARRRTQP